MVRPLRIQYPGALYHVTNRGNERKPIFSDDTDRRKFLEILADSSATYSVRLYSFVLMTNHFHLLVETPRGNLSEFMRHFNITYTSAFNRRHQRVGHLYQGRYKSVLVDGDAYLSMVSRYIHLNPVKVGAVRRKSVKDQLQYLWKYKWSSLPGYVSSSRRVDFVDYPVILEEYGGDCRSGRSRYKKQIAGDLVEGLPLKKKIVGQCLLGEEDFVGKIREEFLEGGLDRERPALAEVKRYLGQKMILETICRVTGKNREEILFKAGPLRQMAMDLLYRVAGMNNPKIGKLMGVDYSTVSQGRKRFKEKIYKDKRLQAQQEKIERLLSRIKICPPSTLFDPPPLYTLSTLSNHLSNQLEMESLRVTA
jgi:putative transposase